jgi:hypothetical protein
MVRTGDSPSTVDVFLGGGRYVLMVAAVGGVLLAALCLLCLTAYMLRAKLIEVSAGIPRLLFFSIKIESSTSRAAIRAQARNGVDATHRS